MSSTACIAHCQNAGNVGRLKPWNKGGVGLQVVCLRKKVEIGIVSVEDS